MKSKQDKEWSEWTDSIGNVFRPGDYVAYPVPYSTSSTQMLIGVVERINRYNSKKEEIKLHDGTLSCTVTIRATQYTMSQPWGMRQGKPKLTTVQNVKNVIRVFPNEAAIQIVLKEIL